MALKPKQTVCGQVIVCKGCCCGDVARGKPDVPVHHLKSAWKHGRLSEAVTLTVSDCLGPCELTNVAVVATAAGTQWFGNLCAQEHYDALVEWARETKEAGAPASVPENLEPHRFEMYWRT